MSTLTVYFFRTPDRSDYPIRLQWHFAPRVGDHVNLTIPGAYEVVEFRVVKFTWESSEGSVAHVDIERAEAES